MNLSCLKLYLDLIVFLYFIFSCCTFLFNFSAFLVFCGRGIPLELKLRIDGSTHTDVFLAGAVAMVNRNFGALLIMTFYSHGARA